MNTNRKPLILLNPSNSPEEGKKQNGISWPEVNLDEFKTELTDRIGKRKVLMEVIHENLTLGKDYLIIPIWNSKLKRNFNSKPFLTKAGAEKICGMLGLTVHYPNLERYEKMIFKGKEIKNIVIKCELISSNGNVVAEGMGCRSNQQDISKSKTNGQVFRDINKAVKMALKSAQIDAVLRAGGLSEIFTQDEDSVDQYNEVQKAVKSTGQKAKVVNKEVPKNKYSKPVAPAVAPAVPPVKQANDIPPIYNSLSRIFDKLSDGYKDDFKKWGKQEGWESIHNIPIELTEDVKLKLTHALVIDESYRESSKYCIGSVHPAFGLPAHNAMNTLSSEVFQIPNEQLKDLTIAIRILEYREKCVYFRTSRDNIKPSLASWQTAERKLNESMLKLKNLKHELNEKSVYKKLKE